MDRDVATAQLASLRGSRAAVADRAVPPWWYDAVGGLLVFQLFAAQSVDRPVVTVAAAVVFAAGLWCLVRAYQRETGFWVNGLRAGRTREAVAVWFALGVVFVAISRWWTRLYVAELREEL